jgi:predicted CoA-binding protein
MGSGRMNTVLVIGAGNNSYRYSNIAMGRLISEGYGIITVNPLSEINTSEPTFHGLSDVHEEIDTAVVYVRAELLERDIDELIRIAPTQVISAREQRAEYLPVNLKEMDNHWKRMCYGSAEHRRI